MTHHHDYMQSSCSLCRSSRLTPAASSSKAASINTLQEAAALDDLIDSLMKAPSQPEASPFEMPQLRMNMTLFEVLLGYESLHLNTSWEYLSS